jgi:hypothetical protein
MVRATIEFVGVMGLRFTCFFGWALLLLLPREAREQPSAEKTTNTKPVFDGAKVVAIERPAKQLLERSRLEAYKGAVVERSTKRMVTTEFESVATSQEESGNPLALGLVRWHATFRAACEAAGHSGKPVLLFQLLGRLDQEFC